MVSDAHILVVEGSCSSVYNFSPMNSGTIVNHDPMGNQRSNMQHSSSHQCVHQSALPGSTSDVRTNTIVIMMSMWWSDSAPIEGAVAANRDMLLMALEVMKATSMMVARERGCEVSKIMEQQ